jgi:hypothetical protein
VLSYARNLPNVSQVKSFIQVGNEGVSAPAAAPSRNAPSSASPLPLSPPPPPPPEAPPAPAPRGGSIEVQPLQ